MANTVPQKNSSGRSYFSMGQYLDFVIFFRSTVFFVFFSVVRKDLLDFNPTLLFFHG
jgi:hypothetical protein